MSEYNQERQQLINSAYQAPGSQQAGYTMQITGIERGAGNCETKCGGIVAQDLQQFLYSEYVQRRGL